VANRTFFLHAGDRGHTTQTLCGHTTHTTNNSHGLVHDGPVQYRTGAMALAGLLAIASRSWSPVCTADPRGCHSPLVPERCAAQPALCTRGASAFNCTIEGKRAHGHADDLAWLRHRVGVSERQDASSVRPGRSGAWNSSATQPYCLDGGLSRALAAFFRGASVVEFGAGQGCYSDVLQRSGVAVRAFEGAPGIEDATRGFVRYADLSAPLAFGASQWVLCLEVAEHLPRAHTAQLLANWHAHNTLGLVISWSMAKAGNGHVNPRPHSWVKQTLANMCACRRAPCACSTRGALD
jgi:hypothetical protein